MPERIVSSDSLPERPEWQHEGACISGGDSSGIFFPQGRRDEVERKNRQAKDICQSCGVIEKCLDYALSRREPHGTWGGMTVKERNVILKNQKSSSDQAG